MRLSAPYRRSLPRCIFYSVGGAVLGLLLAACAYACATTTFVSFVFISITLLTALGFLVGRNEDALEASSVLDPLTGLPNRRFFSRRLAEEFERASRHGIPLALLVIDVDRLKQINDEQGHKRGDEALRVVAESLRRSCRATDVPARYGGDEFVLLAPHTTASQAMTLGNRIRAALESHGRLAEVEGALSVSVGVADIDRSRIFNPSSLFDLADRALYLAKTGGRNRVDMAPEGPVAPIPAPSSPPHAT
jgi:diguanylate cyclase (GGDEF)-like protein